MTVLDAALEYLEQGLCVIPICADQKRPLVKWLEYQTRHPTEEEWTEWFRLWPDCMVAVVTGRISNLYVADCDNDEALNFAATVGMTSTPVKVKTKRGWHFYFRPPADDERRGPRAGINSTGIDWPKVPGLDFRGDGSYALLPPSKDYEWRIDTGFDLDEASVWTDWRPAAPPAAAGAFVFEELDLSAIPVSLDSLLTEWDRTERFVRQEGFPNEKIPTGRGNGRNERVMRYASEQIVEGHFGPALRLRCRKFMGHFFEDPLPEREFEDTMRSVEAMERRNHPERFDEDGLYIFRRADVRVEEEERKESPRRLIVSSDAERLIKEGEGRSYIIEPWLRPASITQIHGYSGSGKTLFLQTALYAMAAGAPNFGPFEISRQAKVLYMDFELSQADMGRRLLVLDKMFGSAGDGLQIWAPWIDQQDINLRKQKGIADLVDWIIWANPEVIVIDTIRTAWSGLSENDAKEWSQVNELAIRLRNRGKAVIMLHHSNKPGDSGLGREAGSTNQLTVLETQIRVAQVYRDEETAIQKAGVWDGKYTKSVFATLTDKLPPDWFLSMVMEVTYGKVREWTDLHDQTQWIGWATHAITGEQRIVATNSSKQKAKNAALAGMSPARIAQELNRPLAVINTWIGLI